MAIKSEYKSEDKYERTLKRSYIYIYLNTIILK